MKLFATTALIIGLLAGSAHAADRHDQYPLFSWVDPMHPAVGESVTVHVERYSLPKVGAARCTIRFSGENVVTETVSKRVPMGARFGSVVIDPSLQLTDPSLPAGVVTADDRHCHGLG
jgi:hypothetical protein